MKKIYLSIFSLLCLNSVFSQVQINRSDIGQIGDTIYYANIDSFYTNISVQPNGGANLTWNFRNIDTIRFDTLVFNDPTEVADAPPTANIAISKNGENVFLMVDSTGILQIQENPITGDIVSVKQLEFPAIYGQQFTDSLDVELFAKGADIGFALFDSVWVTATGVTQVHCDAHGILVTDRDSANTIRVKTITASNINVKIKLTPIDPSWTQLINNIDTTYNYRWFSNDFNYFIAEATTTKNGDMRRLSWQVDSITTKNPNTFVKRILSQNDMKLYPNPTNQTLHVEMKKDGNVTYSIFDMKGRNILSGSNANHVLDIDVSNLKEGMYTCKINQGGTIVSKKFIVNH
jgi:hypothetical protein